MATTADAAAQVRDASGDEVSSSPGFATFPVRSALTQLVVAHGQHVGLVIVRFNEQGLGDAARAFQSTRWHDRLVAGGIAALIALIVSIFFSRLITSPLEAMLRAQRARGAGDRNARVEVEGGVGIVGEVVDGFNWSANVLDQQDRLAAQSRRRRRA